MSTRMQHLGGVCVGVCVCVMAMIYWQHVNSAASLIIHRRVCSHRYTNTVTVTATATDTVTVTDTDTYVGTLQEDT